jgi:hypothetical protein
MAAEGTSREAIMHAKRLMKTGNAFGKPVEVVADTVRLLPA